MTMMRTKYMKLLLSLFAASLASPPVYAQSFTVLFSFNSVNGAFPTAPVIRDSAGNLFGTTKFANPQTGAGNVFKLDPSGNETVLFQFTGGADGGHPMGGLVEDSSGNLYGTAQDGGDLNCFFPGTSGGCGVVFKLDSRGSETVLHTFVGGVEGASPDAALIRDSAGNLYGTAEFGGELNCGSGQGCGIVFQLNPSGNFTILHRFTGTDGSNPTAALVLDSAGNLFSTTSASGEFSGGTVFKLAPTGKLTVLHSFGRGKDGKFPTGGVISDSSGNLFGTTIGGGGSGLGTVYKVGSTGSETVLHSFANQQGEGQNPVGGLLLDAFGNLFGTTASGGDLNACAGEPTPGCGIIFELVSGRQEKVLHIFEENADGAQPLATLIQDPSGKLLGTTANGGPNGFGVVFKLVP